MLSHGVHFAKYGTQTTFYVALEDATVADTPFLGVAPLAADIFLSQDGGAPVAATNGMTAIGNGIYSWVATAAEMQATRLAVSVYDQTATEIFLPIFFIVQTKLLLGQMECDATQIGGNTPGLYLKATGTASGLHAEGGATGHGVKAKGGATSGNGIDAEAAVDGAGLRVYCSAGDGFGIEAFGRGVSEGIYVQGGATDAAGILVEAQGEGTALALLGGPDGGHGLDASGQDTGHGLFARSLGTGVGFYAAATGGTSAGFRADGGSGGAHGAHFVGGGAGDGLRAQAGTSGYGFFGVGAGGGAAANFGGSGSAFSWDDLEGTEPSGAPVDNASFRQILQYLKRYLLNRATETAVERQVFKDDSSTPLFAQTVNDDEVTQDRGKAT